MYSNALKQYETYLLHFYTDSKKASISSVATTSSNMQKSAKRAAEKPVLEEVKRPKLTEMSAVISVSRSNCSFGSSYLSCDANVWRKQYLRTRKRTIKQSKF